MNCIGNAQAWSDESELSCHFGASAASRCCGVYRGAIDDNAKNKKKVKKPYVADAIDAMLAGNTIKYASTKALGCGIKFKN